MILMAAMQAGKAQDVTPPASSQPAAVGTPDPAPQVSKPAVPGPSSAAPTQPRAKKVKDVYTGPTTVITEPGTPMLDEEGKQRIDPDGKPMFNPPSVQMRDKKGHPVFDANGKPVFRTATDAGYDEKGKKIPVKKVKPVKTVPVLISRGTFTVDGMIGKGELNYTIPDFKFVYLYAPGIGTAIVSNSPFPGATVQKNGFSDNTLTVFIEDHKLQLASDKQIVGKRGHPEPAYVEVDRQFTLPSPFPVVGYGPTERAPYRWPGSKPNAQIAGIIAPPPTPKNLRPVMLLAPCPKGQMRMPGPPVLPGQDAPEQPCVPITKALQDKSSQPAEATTKVADAVPPAAGATPAQTPAGTSGSSISATVPAAPPQHN